MNTASVTAVVAIASGITFFAYLFAFVFGMAKRRLAPRATNYLFAALGLLACSWLIGVVAFPIAGSFYSPASFGLISIFMRLGQSAVSAVALGLFVSAIYVDRPERSTKRDDFLRGDQEPPHADANPFVSPRQ